MADIQKFLDKSGVSTLWTQVVTRITTDVEAEKSRAKAAEATLTEDLSSEVTRAKAAEKANADAIAILNGASSVEGSVAFQIAQIVASADADFDTLKEIADWISTHNTDATTMNSSIATNKNNIATNAAAIKDLEELVGDKAVATQISEAIAAQDLSKYALASNLTTLSNELSTLKGTGSRLITADEIAKLAKLVMADDGSVSMSGSIAAGNVQGLSAAIDDRIAAQVVALTEAEIKSAIGVE